MDYIVDPDSGKIPWDKILSHRLVDKDHHENDSESVALTLNGNYVWAYKGHDGSTSFTKYGGNDGDGILTQLEDDFKVKILSEYDGKYWKIMESEEAEA